MKLDKGYSRKIDNQFSIHIAGENKEVFEKILELNILNHGEPVREYLTRIFWEHPRKKELLWLYIKDSEMDKIVSSISLFPLEWHMESIIIPLCEMGFVGTLKNYRGKGFIRELNSLYEQIMADRGYLISAIRGIPYFYRKLNYEFVLPLDYRILLNPSKIPKSKKENLRIRKVKHEETNKIKQMYENLYGTFYIWNVFDLKPFIFMYFNQEHNDFQSQIYLIESNGNPEAYFTFGASYDNLGYEIKSSKLTEDHCIKILQFVKEKHRNTETSKIDLAIREETDLADFVLKLGGNPYNSYGWQIKIPNLKNFFKMIRPILEKRIENTEFKHLTQVLKISNYHEILEISFNKGLITYITSTRGYPELGSCDIQIPDALLFKLLLGDKTFGEINYIIKDAMIKRESKQLIDRLFPKEKSFPESYY